MELKAFRCLYGQQIPSVNFEYSWIDEIVTLWLGLVKGTQAINPRMTSQSWIQNWYSKDKPRLFWNMGSRSTHGHADVPKFAAFSPLFHPESRPVISDITNITYTRDLWFWRQRHLRELQRDQECSPVWQAHGVRDVHRSLRRRWLAPTWRCQALGPQDRELCHPQRGYTI